MDGDPVLTEPARTIPVVCEADVVVVGGSCTGVFAAIRAARLGYSAVVIERHNAFGGVATAACVNIWHSLQDTQYERTIIAGLTREVIDRLQRRGAVVQFEEDLDAFRLNTEELKIELDELVTAHRITPFLNTFYAAPVLEDGRLTAVIIENKNGRQAVRGRMFIDATGDAALSLHLGLPMLRPDSLQPPTTCAKIAGLSTLRRPGQPRFDWQAAVREHGAEFGLVRDWGWGTTIPGLEDIQMRADTHVFGGDTSDGDWLTWAEMEGRRQVRAIMDVIRKYGPSDQAVALVDLAASIGARETRRIACRYRITEDDVLNGRRFDDAVANGSYRVDIHHADGPGITFRYLDGTEFVIEERGLPGRSGRWRDPLPEDPVFYQIPFRALLQERIPNLMLAGRMLDADKTAFSAVRVMVNMNQTGEAAGAACALALREGCDVQAIDPAALRTLLAEGGSVVI